jgi:exonuclease VII small subunit
MFCSTIAVGLAGFFFAYLAGNGGVDGSSHVWIFTYPLIAIFLLGNQRGAFYSLVLFGFSGIVFFAGKEFSFFKNYDFNLAIRALPAYFLIFLFATVMEELREEIQKSLNDSKLEMEESVKELEKAREVKENLIKELQQLMSEVSTLQGILPMCSCCKKIRNDDGYWDRVENFITEHTEAQFSHGICPDCIKELYSEEDFDDD